jgi:hypothetical protein
MSGLSESSAGESKRGPLATQPTFVFPGLNDAQTYLRSASQYLSRSDADDSLPATSTGQKQGKEKGSSFRSIARSFRGGFGLPSLESNMSFLRSGHGDDESKSLLGKTEASDALVIGDQANPEVNASWLSSLFFSYANPLITLGSKKHLQQTDLWETAPFDLSEPVYNSYQKLLLESADEESPQVSEDRSQIWLFRLF